MKDTNWDDLKEIEQLIRSPKTRKQGATKLLSIVPEEMPVLRRMHYYYIKGEFHNQEAYYYDPMLHISEANRCYDQLFTIACLKQVEGIRISYYLSAISTKLKLIDICSESYMRERLAAEAIRTADEGLKHFPTNIELQAFKLCAENV